MSVVRFLETTAPVARAISRKQLAVEVGANSPRVEFGMRFDIPGGFNYDPRHPATRATTTKTKEPGPGTYEAGPLHSCITIVAFSRPNFKQTLSRLYKQTSS